MRYRDLSIDVVRGKDVVARVIPPVMSPGFPIERLNGLIATLPKLHVGDAEEFLEDLRALDKTLATEADPWAS